MSRWRDIKQSKDVQSANVKVPVQELEPCAKISSRLKAFAIDSFLVTTPILYIVIYLVMGSGEVFFDNKGSGWLIIIGVNLPIILTFWLKTGQTPGLKAYSIKLVNSTTKQKVRFFQATIRYFLTLFSIITIFLMFLPFIRKDKRTFQDIFSNSYITHE